MNRFFRWALKLDGIVALLLMSLLPFFLYFVMALGNVFFFYQEDVDVFYVPPFETWILLIHVVYFLWVWAVGIAVNQAYANKGTKLFRACYFAYLTYVLYSVLSVGFVNFPHDWAETNTFLYWVKQVYTLFTYFSYFYIAWFIGKVVKSLPPVPVRSSYDSLAERGTLLLVVFPLGIPLLQKRVKLAAYTKNVYGLTMAHTNTDSDAAPPQKEPLAPERKEDEPVSGKKKDDTDESDWSSYMPK